MNPSTYGPLPGPTQPGTVQPVPGNPQVDIGPAGAVAWLGWPTACALLLGLVMGLLMGFWCNRKGGG